MKVAFPRTRRAAVVLAGLTVGVVLAVVFVANRQAPTHGEIPPQVPVLSVIEVQPLEFRLEARGYGTARPAETWQAIANVAGRVVERRDDLESGTLLPKGTLLLALDPSRYELAIAEAEAELGRLAAEKTHLKTEEDNTRRLLELERDRLILSEQELSRIERMAESGSVSRSVRDEQQRATLAQRQAVASLKNQMALIPSRRKQLQAEMERAETRVAQARRDLEDTRFEAPYDLRLGDVQVEMHQHVAVGQQLFEADSITAAEVEAHIPYAMLRRLMGSVTRSSTISEDSLDLGGRLDLSDIRAEVELVGAEGIGWPARVTRVASGLDPGTRTARVVVTVDEPYRNARPPDHPPLQRNTYVGVRLSTENPEPLLVIPAAAVHHGEVYRVDDQDRLERSPVKVAYEQNDLAVIRSGLTAGDRVIVDDPVPALDGMAVTPRRDEALEQRLQAMAQGEAP
ncbi:efflux RND transporter periplasmic adaptor subunit [Thiohalomonas denitrificans]|uniref:RND family efflux transporter, MFP subunit n=1 Tax=Thiohalomonas denitrificans TaxID=415747 RepID=A0A1G5Q9V4_9GAMM|nr:efflux RND transporter periplasmic adaptor subunit [Thiohalomonas denitrificans]SCZ58398.1 RND family efflux transporter, MFP subunit [Thiohalomonas denitrificans]